MRHTNDNVNGHTLHTLVYSFSQVPIQVTWERELNDNSEKASERLYHGGITPMAASHGDLRQVGTGMDLPCSINDPIGLPIKFGHFSIVLKLTHTLVPTYLLTLLLLETYFELNRK